MARETKIGLLVGMGFIVCVAIILSQRAENRDTNTPRSADVTRPGEQVPAATEATAAERKARNLGPRPASSPQQRTPAPPRQADDTDRGIRPPAQIAGRPSPAPDGQRGNPPAPAPTGTPTGERFAQRGPALPNAAPGGEASSPTPEPTTVVRAMPDELTPPLVPNMPGSARPTGTSTEDILTALGASPPPATREASTPGGTQAAPPQADAAFLDILAHHTVEPGDSLSRIGRKYYGAVTPDLLTALYKANKEVMRDPNHLVVGRELVVPLLAGLTPEGTPEPSPVASPLPVANDPRSPATPDANAPAVVLATHTIKRGDNLKRIAQTYYNSSSQRVVQAIYEANRQAMSSPDRLIAGKTIVLPVIEPAGNAPAGNAPAPAGTEAAAPPERQSEPAGSVNAGAGEEGAAWRWYSLKKGDTYSTVSSEQLGTCKRWRELAELNRDIFPDAQKIRPGVRIRVPLGEVPATPEPTGDGNDR